MGIKGDKLTKESVFSAELLTEKLASIGGITTKKMFGGHGIFHDGKMFGIIDSKGICFLRINETTQSDYEENGGVRHSRMPYFSLPEQIFNDLDKFLIWAKKSIEISK